MIRTINTKHLIGDPLINQHFATLVSSFRSERGYVNHKQFANRLKVNERTIKRLEDANGCASLGDYFIISMYLGIKDADFWYFVVNQQPCQLIRVAIPDHSKKLYGLNERYHRDANYKQLCKEIDGYVASYISRLIDTCHKSQEELCKQLGKPQSSIANIKVGRRILRLSEFVSVCEAIGVQSKDVITHIMNRMEEAREHSGKAKF